MEPRRELAGDDSGAVLTVAYITRLAREARELRAVSQRLIAESRNLLLRAEDAKRLADHAKERLALARADAAWLARPGL